MHPDANNGHMARYNKRACRLLNLFQQISCKRTTVNSCCVCVNVSVKERKEGGEETHCVELTRFCPAGLTPAPL